MSTANVLPCPFCGGTEIETVQGDTFRWRVARCNACGAQSGDARIQTAGSGSRDDWERRARVEALAEWNLRAVPDGDQFTDNPDDAQLVDACLSLRHDFGLLNDADQAREIESMREHWRAIWKAVHSKHRHVGTGVA